MNCHYRPEAVISPEVPLKGWLFVQFDIPDKRGASVNISLMKVWRFLPQNASFCVPSEYAI